jgi:membrane protein DedA with SNARE-associated domain
VLDALTEFITGTVADYGYVAVFLLMTLESACIPIPSEVTMLFGGALASAAFAGDAQLSLFGVTAAGVVGNVLGSWLAYWVGAWGGRPLVDRYGRYLLIRPHEVDKAHAWFEQRGELTVFVSRLLPVIRTFISLPAGIARMPFWRFTLYTTLGCVPFVFFLALGGRLAGEHWETVRNVLEPASWAIAIALIVLLVVFVRRRWRLVRAEYAALDAVREEGATE